MNTNLWDIVKIGDIITYPYGYKDLKNCEVLWVGKDKESDSDLILLHPHDNEIIRTKMPISYIKQYNLDHRWLDKCYLFLDKTKIVSIDVVKKKNRTTDCIVCVLKRNK